MNFSLALQFCQNSTTIKSVGASVGVLKSILLLKASLVFSEFTWQTVRPCMKGQGSLMKLVCLSLQSDYCIQKTWQMAIEIR